MGEEGREGGGGWHSAKIRKASPVLVSEQGNTSKFIIKSYWAVNGLSREAWIGQRNRCICVCDMGNIRKIKNYICKRQTAEMTPWLWSSICRSLFFSFSVKLRSFELAWRPELFCNILIYVLIFLRNHKRGFHACHERDSKSLYELSSRAVKFELFFPFAICTSQAPSVHHIGQQCFSWARYDVAFDFQLNCFWQRQEIITMVSKKWN